MVDLDVDALLEQPELVLDVPLVAVVADDDPVGRDALLEQDRDLLRAEPPGPLAVRADRHAGLALGARGRPEHALLGRAEEVHLGPDLADDAGADVRPVRTVDDVADQQLGQLVDAHPGDVVGVDRLAVPAGAHHDVDPGRLRRSGAGPRAAARSRSSSSRRSTARRRP